MSLGIVLRLGVENYWFLLVLLGGVDSYSMSILIFEFYPKQLIKYQSNGICMITIRLKVNL